jgi:hypothetical protein
MRRTQTMRIRENKIYQLLIEFASKERSKLGPQAPTPWSRGAVLLARMCL